MCAEREKKKTRRSRKTEEKALRGGKMSGGLGFAALKQVEMFHSVFLWAHFRLIFQMR